MTEQHDFRTQGRGGVGAKGSTTRDEDFIEHLYVASMHNTIVLFTESGRCFWLKVYDIPEGTRTSKGRAIQNLLNIEQEDKVKAYLRVKDLSDEEYINNNYISLTTKRGTIKKTSLEAYSRPRQNGINAITINEGDQLLEAKLTQGERAALLAPAREGLEAYAKEVRDVLQQVVDASVGSAPLNPAPALAEAA